MMNGSLLVLGLSGPELTVAEAELFRRLQPAGFILFSRNITSPQQTRKLTDDLRGLCSEEPIIAIDQEGGKVTRTKDIAPVPPSAAALAAKANPADIANVGALTGDFLRLLGFNLDFAPVLDLDHFPGLQNSLRGRCWGRDPQRVIDYAGQWNRWLRKRYIASCGKHFPACGRAVSDPHFDLPSSPATLDELLREDVIPYTALMPELDSIMLAHVDFPNIDPDFPASLSPRIIRRFLRDQLGFEKHVVLTDDLDMGAITGRYGRGQDVKMAIEAGNDLAMICHKIETAEVAAKAIAELPYWMIDEAHQRLARLRKKLCEPLTWSDASWQKTCDAIAEFAAKIPEEGTGQAQSPVADY
ncbi:glycosyl hydrolase [Luteolibacter pohnpeiensis]|uniref:beta-N-acetylhexosaminidase n=1 Tax=Luteolibacter pohnpeiensis TaxID=454153 RepID=A0A934S8A6_9BACT|nr:glycoside hydrolase family 3 N-terminal domain-containing protein [Luteolibacter pohnpeiensis]MBK1882676.1 glycosyl hydrolase [Luteolibacter pohnpeiensis]